MPAGYNRKTMLSAVGVLIFLGMALIDIMWAKYMQHANRGDRLIASLYSMMLFLITSGTVLIYTDDPMILPWGAAGAFLGTFIGIRPKSQQSHSHTV